MFSLWRKARRENSAASRLLGSTSLRFALHGWQRLRDRPRLTARCMMPSMAFQLSPIRRETAAVEASFNQSMT
ncbi:hypothetical protein, partial [Thiolapillus sp.]|uniref:hypothetical protein n=1 Tax=Thiolapillus sp. TaxID=2017437 RepID=UPI003AF81860